MGTVRDVSREKIMNISPIVNSVKCTFFACIVHFLHVLEGSTALRFMSGGRLSLWSPLKTEKTGFGKLAHFKIFNT